MYTLELVWLRTWFLLLLCFWSGYLCSLSLSLLFPFSLYIYGYHVSLCLYTLLLLCYSLSILQQKEGDMGMGRLGWLIVGLDWYVLIALLVVCKGCILIVIISISFPYYCILITWLYFFPTHRFTLVIVFQCVQITSIGIVYWILMHLSIPNMCLDD